MYVHLASKATLALSIQTGLLKAISGIRYERYG